MQATQPAQSLRRRSPGLHSSGAPNGGESHPPLRPQGRRGLYLAGALATGYFFFALLSAGAVETDGCSPSDMPINTPLTSAA